MMQSELTTTATADTTTSAARFPLGQTVITRGALAALEETGEQPHEFLRRHQACDWGDICAEDRRENELSLRQGFRLLSVYRTKASIKLYVITEWDRSVTTLLLSEEY